jgi:hypothetical protein
MKKYPIGFNTSINKEPEESVPMEVCKGVIEPKKSVVQVYFPHRGMGWAYYNDTFDLKVGDFVYVEEDGFAVRKNIVAGISSSEYIEIKEGLTTSDKVIVYSQTLLEEGMAVAVIGAQEEP